MRLNDTGQQSVSGLGAVGGDEMEDDPPTSKSNWDIGVVLNTNLDEGAALWPHRR